MKACKCGSYAINHHCHGRDGTDSDLCDVCYWRKRAEQPAQQEPFDCGVYLGTGKEHTVKHHVSYGAAQQEPAPKVVDCHATGVCVQSGLWAEKPAQRTWVGLSDKEWFDICEANNTLMDTDFIHAIEATLREKNT